MTDSSNGIASAIVHYVSGVVSPLIDGEVAGATAKMARPTIPYLGPRPRGPPEHLAQGDAVSLTKAGTKNTKAGTKDTKGDTKDTKGGGTKETKSDTKGR